MELLAGPGILRTHLGRHGAGPEDCPRREAALASYPIACLVPPSTPDLRQGHPRRASHDWMTTSVRSAPGPLPVSHGLTVSYYSSGDRAMPASHIQRCQSGRSVVGRIAGPYRHCHSTERAVGRTRAGHVHAGRIADGVNSRGAALCASGLAPCGASWAGTRCRIASDARPRRHGDTGPGRARPPAMAPPTINPIIRTA